MKSIKCVRGAGLSLGEPSNNPLFNNDVRPMLEAGRVNIDEGTGFIVKAVDANYTPNLMPRQIGVVGDQVGYIERVSYSGEYKKTVPIHYMKLDVGVIANV
jgi:hypothetical protein